MNAVQQHTQPDIIERVMIEGDLSNLTVPQRIEYYGKVCDSMKLNALTKPFDYLRLNGKLFLYANKNAAEQIRRNLKMSITLPEKKIENGVYIVTARAEADGRCDESTGAVNVDGLKGDALANAIMKTETKAKRRATLSFAGLGMLDETEVESIPDAQKVTEKDITSAVKKTETTATQEPAKDSIRTHVEELFGKPETKTAQEKWEREKARLAAIPKDIKEFFRWKKTTKKQIFEILDANNEDFEAVRGYMTDNGWKGSASLSDVAEHDKMPDDSDAF